MSSGGGKGGRLNMKGQIHKAYKVMLKLVNPKYVSKDKGIPLKILQNAKGIAFVTTLRGGFIFSGTLGSGIVIAKLPDGSWSGPSSLGVGGMGWGLQIGGSFTDSVIVLNTNLAVKAFSGKGQIKFGGNLQVAAGPVGRDADAAVNAGDGGIAACYSYSHSRGAFAGLSLQGAVLFARPSDNRQFYAGASGDPTKILKGEVKPPTDCADLNNLYKILRVVLNSKTADMSFRDSTTGTLKFEDDSDDDEKYYRNNSFMASDASTKNLGPVGSDDPSAGLPPGWRAVPADSGEYYYWNEKTNEVQWDKPAGSKSPPVNPYEQQKTTSLPYGGTSAINTSSPIVSTSVGGASQQSRGYATSTPPASAPTGGGWGGSSPSGMVPSIATASSVSAPSRNQASSDWTAIRTPQGEEYYWNKTTNETRWDKPAEMSVPVAQPVQASSPRAPTQTYRPPAPTAPQVPPPMQAAPAPQVPAPMHSVPANHQDELQRAMTARFQNASLNSTPAASAPPPTPAYQQPAPVYQQPQAPVYQQPQAPVYQQPQAPVYQQPKAQAYQQPQAPMYQQAPAPVYHQQPEPAAATVPARPNIPRRPQGGAATPPPAAPAPAVNIAPTMTLEQVQGSRNTLEASSLEMYLTDAAFQKTFNMNRQEFEKLPKWRRDKLKKDANLF